MSALPPYPNGWFVAALARDLPKKGVITRTFMGREIVLFRTAGGTAVAVDAHCPHLGAHLGCGGRVEGETIRCPFHGFRFDAAGACVATEDGAPIRPKARLGTWALREQNGLLLVHHDDAGRAPAWEVPVLDDDGFAPWQFHEQTARIHPQDATENSVDWAHFTAVHGYRDLVVRSPVQSDGPRLFAGYAFSRPTLRGLPPVRVEIDVEAHGLGYSLVSTHLPRLGIRLRQLVLVSATRDGQGYIRLGVSFRRRRETGLGLGPLAEVLGAFTMKHYIRDVGQDVPIWANKIHVEPPALSMGDGPIGLYRKWARQFHPDTDADPQRRRKLVTTTG